MSSDTYSRGKALQPLLVPLCMSSLGGELGDVNQLEEDAITLLFNGRVVAVWNATTLVFDEENLVL